MSHIVSFSIDGLAGRKDLLELELNRDTNIFFGLNGSGKTSLLKILHSAMANSTEYLHNVPFKSAKVKIYSLKYEKTFTRSILKKELTADIGRSDRHIMRREVIVDEQLVLFEDIDSTERLEWKCTPSTPRGAASTSWSHEYLPTTRLHVGEGSPKPYFEGSRTRRPFLTEEQLDLYFAQSVEYLWNRYSSKILASVRRAQEQGLAGILRTVLSSGSIKRRPLRDRLSPETAYERVQNFLKRQGSSSVLGTQSSFEKRYIEDPTLQKVVRDIDSVEDQIEEAMASRNMLERLIKRMFTGNKRIQFTDQSIKVLTPSGDKIGLTSLSSGEKHLLRIFVQSLLARESSMMIDEPELSMHVDWQKELIKSLRALNSETQLILATHSPEIMADVPDDKIFRI